MGGVARRAAARRVPTLREAKRQADMAYELPLAWQLVDAPPAWIARPAEVTLA